MPLSGQAAASNEARNRNYRLWRYGHKGKVSFLGISVPSPGMGCTSSHSRRNSITFMGNTCNALDLRLDMCSKYRQLHKNLQQNTFSVTPTYGILQPEIKSFVLPANNASQVLFQNFKRYTIIIIFVLLTVVIFKWLCVVYTTHCNGVR
jgi:hypothetical protein